MKKNKGFTLVELLAVIVILGVLLSFSSVAVVKLKKKQDIKNRENVINSILTGAKKYAADNPNILSNLTSINVVDLTANGSYVSFDTEKYADFLNKDSVVEIKSCGIDSLKLKYSFKEYNDCGCEEQTAATGKTLCNN